MMVPKDLGIRIGTKDEVVWEKVKINVERIIKDDEEDLMVQKEILKLCKQKIKEEQKK